MHRVMLMLMHTFKRILLRITTTYTPGAEVAEEEEEEEASDDGFSIDDEGLSEVSPSHIVHYSLFIIINSR